MSEKKLGERISFDFQRICGTEQQFIQRSRKSSTCLKSGFGCAGCLYVKNGKKLSQPRGLVPNFRHNKKFNHFAIKIVRPGNSKPGFSAIFVQNIIPLSVNTFQVAQKFALKIFFVVLFAAKTSFCREGEISHLSERGI
jgi:hypothetical protein